MQMTSFNLFTATWLLFLFMKPLRSNPERALNYENYYSLDHQVPLRSKNLQRENVAPYYQEPSSRIIYSSQPWDLTTPVDSQFVQSQMPQRGSQEAYYNNREVPQSKERGDNFNDRQSNFQEQRHQNEETNWKEQEITEKMNILDRVLSQDLNKKDLETNMIDDILPEEAKRVVRQARKQRPGFFWTLARVTFETINETRSAIQQISEIINSNIAPDSATESTMVGSLTAVESARPKNETNLSNNTTNINTTSSTMRPTTTERPFVLTRSGLQTIIRRNLKGLIKLFNIEWRDALNQSEVSVREFQRNLGNQVGSYLQDNPNAY